MQVVFLAYSNSRQDPLPTLKEEDEKVYSLLSRRAAQLHFHIHRDSFATVNSIIEYLELYRREIIVFSFSGHAGRDQLLLEGQSADARGIAGLLSRCPKLRLVLLNGCSTAEQARRLQGLPNRPTVIATQAPVGDYSATRFGISFFRELAEQRGTLEEAFQAGLSAARTVAQHEILEQRKLGARKDKGQPADANLWALYTDEEKSLNWKLPVEPDSETQRWQSIKWIKWWGIYQIGGILLLYAFSILLPSSAKRLDLVPLFFYFAPFLPTLRSRLGRKRLYILLATHAGIYFSLLYIWMKEDTSYYWLFLALGLGIYFFILPLINRIKP